MIHPTAVVSKEAELGEDVHVGPYAIVEGNAVIGARCVIEAHAVVTKYVRMGPDNVVGVGAVLGGDPQDLRFDRAQETHLYIGSNNRIREHCTLHRGAQPSGRTVIGNDNFIMVGTHVGHDCRVGSKVVFANGVMLGGHVVVEDGVFLGGGTVVHQFVRIGRMAISQGNSSLSKDLPPFLMSSELNTVVGLNVVGLKRGGVSTAQRTEIKEAFNSVYRRGYNFSQALELSRSRSWGSETADFWRFLEETGKRGICGWRGKRVRKNSGGDGVVD